MTNPPKQKKSKKAAPATPFLAELQRAETECELLSVVDQAMEAGDRKIARLALERITHSHDWLRVAHAWRQLGDKAMAEACLMSAEQAARHTWDWRWLARTRKERGELAHSRRILKKAQNSFFSPHELASLAEDAAACGEGEIARACLDKARLHAVSCWGVLAVSRAAQTLGDHALALHMRESGTQLAKDTYDLCRAAKEWLRVKDVARTRDILRQAEMQAERSWDWTNLAEVWAAVGSKEDAKRCVVLAERSAKDWRDFAAIAQQFEDWTEVPEEDTNAQWLGKLAEEGLERWRRGERETAAVVI